MAETLTREDGWLPMDAAPVAVPVEVRAGGMEFKAILVPYGALDTNENPCDQWQARVEGEHPPCWSDGCCWTVNENEDRSAWPEAWRPSPPLLPPRRASMYVQIRPIGFVAIQRDPYPFLGIRFWRWHMALKPTRRELFSERNGYTKTYRLGGLSFSIRRVPDPI